MVATQELENLQTWLDQHASGYFLSFSKGGVTTAEAVKQLAESCDEIDIEGRRVWMEWTNRQANPSGLRSQSIIAIVDQARCIQLEPKPLTFEAYMERCPEKLELSGGYLGSDIEDAFSLLDLSLESFGLLQVVRRVPKEQWEEALSQVYSSK